MSYTSLRFLSFLPFRLYVFNLIGSLGILYLNLFFLLDPYSRILVGFNDLGDRFLSNFKKIRMFGEAAG
jgi:hypothetical protein